jgi:hypothetical protein
MSAEDETTGGQGKLGGMLSGKIPAIKNIESAYSRAGAGQNHMPGTASKLGSQEQPGAHQGVGSEKFKDSISDQRQEVCSAPKVI